MSGSLGGSVVLLNSDRIDSDILVANLCCEADSRAAIEIDALRFSLIKLSTSRSFFTLAADRLYNFLNLVKSL